MDSDGATGTGFFVVRGGQAGSALPLLVLSTSTYNAYNNWGGASLYDGAATRVSFARPVPKGFLGKPESRDGRFANVSGEDDILGVRGTAWCAAQGVSPYSLSAGWDNWERRFVEWAEPRGYRFEYAVSTDLEAHPELLNGRRLVVSVGHDEYWSWGMRDNLERFIENGGNVAFFSGNAVFWQVRFEDDWRTMVCHKYVAHESDPVLATEREHLMTGMWSDPLVGRPENALTGVSFTRGGYVRTGGGVPRGSGGYLVHRHRHWAFQGTDLRYGDLLGASDGVVGYEADGCELMLEDGWLNPTGRDGTPRDFTVLATSPAHLWSHGVEESDFPERYRDLDEPGDLEFTASPVR